MDQIDGYIFVNYNYNGIDMYNTNGLIGDGYYCLTLHGRIYKKISHHIFNDHQLTTDFTNNNFDYFNTFGEECVKFGYITINNINYDINTDKFGHFRICVNVSVVRSTNNQRKFTFFDQKKNTLLNFNLNVLNNISITPNINNTGNTYSIISDIDDTIKYTNVQNIADMIANTFYKEFIPIDETVKTFNKLESKYNITNYHYVSSSPWQLYQLLHEFIIRYYKNGTIYLKSMDIDNLLTIVKFIKSGNIEYKTPIIDQIINSNKKQKYILIGDSGEHDPEIYNHIYKKYTDLIESVIIRDVFKKNDQLRKRLPDVPLNKISVLN